MSTTTPFTADQLHQLPGDGCRYELVAGELHTMSPAGWKHGAVVSNLHSMIGPYVLNKGLGRVFGAETGFLIGRNPDTVRAPDIAFIHKDHLPTDDPAEAYWPGAPDLAVEVVSPNETASTIDEKVQMWLDAGALQVWVVDDEGRHVTVHSPTADTITLSEADDLNGGQILPGFRCPVRSIFDIR